ncbi:methyltransferase domain-containing protein [Pseudonocardia sp. DSM 110487]|nr:methyltransferase domain-containing protein [Pseudonocardia sp. DSM 110487]
MLDAAPGHTVLEIGTGYNAALLCHRLGSEAVTSIDIDPELVDAARETLMSVGFTPTLVAGDGADGVPERAPFDRILATCAVPAVPGAWGATRRRRAARGRPTRRHVEHVDRGLPRRRRQPRGSVLFHSRPFHVASTARHRPVSHIWGEPRIVRPDGDAPRRRRSRSRTPRRSRLRLPARPPGPRGRAVPAPARPGYLHLAH